MLYEDSQLQTISLATESQELNVEWNILAPSSLFRFGSSLAGFKSDVTTTNLRIAVKQAISKSENLFNIYGEADEPMRQILQALCREGDGKFNFSYLKPILNQVNFSNEKDIKLLCRFLDNLENSQRVPQKQILPIVDLVIKEKLRDEDGNTIQSFYGLINLANSKEQWIVGKLLVQISDESLYQLITLIVTNSTQSIQSREAPSLLNLLLESNYPVEQKDIPSKLRKRLFSSSILLEIFAFRKPKQEVDNTASPEMSVSFEKQPEEESASATNSFENINSLGTLTPKSQVAYSLASLVVKNPVDFYKLFKYNLNSKNYYQFMEFVIENLDDIKLQAAIFSDLYDKLKEQSSFTVKEHIKFAKFIEEKLSEEEKLKNKSAKRLIILDKILPFIQERELEEAKNHKDKKIWFNGYKQFIGEVLLNVNLSTDVLQTNIERLLAEKDEKSIFRLEELVKLIACAYKVDEMSTKDQQRKYFNEVLKWIIDIFPKYLGGKTRRSITNERNIFLLAAVVCQEKVGEKNSDKEIEAQIDFKKLSDDVKTKFREAFQEKIFGERADKNLTSLLVSNPFFIESLMGIERDPNTNEYSNKIDVLQVVRLALQLITLANNYNEAKGILWSVLKYFSALIVLMQEKKITNENKNQLIKAIVDLLDYISKQNFSDELMADAGLSHVINKVTGGEKLKVGNPKSIFEVLWKKIYEEFPGLMQALQIEVKKSINNVGLNEQEENLFIKVAKNPLLFNLMKIKGEDVVSLLRGSLKELQSEVFKAISERFKQKIFKLNNNQRQSLRKIYEELLHEDDGKRKFFELMNFWRKVNGSRVSEGKASCFHMKEIDDKKYGQILEKVRKHIKSRRLFGKLSSNVNEQTLFSEMVRCLEDIKQILSSPIRSEQLWINVWEEIQKIADIKEILSKNYILMFLEIFFELVEISPAKFNKEQKITFQGVLFGNGRVQGVGANYLTSTDEVDPEIFNTNLYLYTAANSQEFANNNISMLDAMVIFIANKDPGFIEIFNATKQFAGIAADDGEKLKEKLSALKDMDALLSFLEIYDANLNDKRDMQMYKAVVNLLRTEDGMLNESNFEVFVKRWPKLRTQIRKLDPTKKDNELNTVEEEVIKDIGNILASYLPQNAVKVFSILVNNIDSSLVSYLLGWNAGESFRKMVIERMGGIHALIMKVAAYKKDLVMNFNDPINAGKLNMVVNSLSDSAENFVEEFARFGEGTASNLFADNPLFYLNVVNIFQKKLADKEEILQSNEEVFKACSNSVEIAKGAAATAMINEHKLDTRLERPDRSLLMWGVQFHEEVIVNFIKPLAEENLSDRINEILQKINNGGTVDLEILNKFIGDSMLRLAEILLEHNKYKQLSSKNGFFSNILELVELLKKKAANDKVKTEANGMASENNLDAQIASLLVAIKDFDIKSLWKEENKKEKIVLEERIDLAKKSVNTKKAELAKFKNAEEKISSQGVAIILCSESLSSTDINPSNMRSLAKTFPYLTSDNFSSSRNLLKNLSRIVKLYQIDSDKCKIFELFADNGEFIAKNLEDVQREVVFGKEVDLAFALLLRDYIQEAIQKVEDWKKEQLEILKIKKRSNQQGSMTEDSINEQAEEKIAKIKEDKNLQENNNKLALKKIAIFNSNGQYFFNLLMKNLDKFKLADHPFLLDIIFESKLLEADNPLALQIIKGLQNKILNENLENLLIDKNLTKKGLACINDLFKIIIIERQNFDRSKNLTLSLFKKPLAEVNVNKQRDSLISKLVSNGVLRSSENARKLMHEILKTLESENDPEGLNKIFQVPSPLLNILLLQDININGVIFGIALDRIKSVFLSLGAQKYNFSENDLRIIIELLEAKVDSKDIISSVNSYFPLTTAPELNLDLINYCIKNKSITLSNDKKDEILEPIIKKSVDLQNGLEQYIKPKFRDALYSQLKDRAIEKNLIIKAPLNKAKSEISLSQTKSPISTTTTPTLKHTASSKDLGSTGRSVSQVTATTSSMPSSTAETLTALQPPNLHHASSGPVVSSTMSSLSSPNDIPINQSKSQVKSIDAQLDTNKLISDLDNIINSAEEGDVKRETLTQPNTISTKPDVSTLTTGTSSLELDIPNSAPATPTELTPSDLEENLEVKNEEREDQQVLKEEVGHGNVDEEETVSRSQEFINQEINKDKEQSQSEAQHQAKVISAQEAEKASNSDSNLEKSLTENQRAQRDLIEGIKYESFKENIVKLVKDALLEKDFITYLQSRSDTVTFANLLENYSTYSSLKKGDRLQEFANKDEVINAFLEYRCQEGKQLSQGIKKILKNLQEEQKLLAKNDSDVSSRTVGDQQQELSTEAQSQQQQQQHTEENAANIVVSSEESEKRIEEKQKGTKEEKGKEKEDKGIEKEEEKSGDDSKENKNDEIAINNSTAAASSSSSSSSAGSAPPPPPPVPKTPKASVPLPAPKSSASGSGATEGRSALLGDIKDFDASKLKKKSAHKESSSIQLPLADIWKEDFIRIKAKASTSSGKTRALNSIKVQLEAIEAKKNEIMKLMDPLTSKLQSAGLNELPFAREKKDRFLKIIDILEAMIKERKAFLSEQKFQFAKAESMKDLLIAGMDKRRSGLGENSSSDEDDSAQEEDDWKDEVSLQVEDESDNGQEVEKQVVGNIERQINEFLAPAMPSQQTAESSTSTQSSTNSRIEGDTKVASNVGEAILEVSNNPTSVGNTQKSTKKEEHKRSSSLTAFFVPVEQTSEKVEQKQLKRYNSSPMLKISQNPN